MNYIRLKQIKNSIKETGNTLIEKTDELTDLVKAQDNQMGTQASDLKESLSTQSKLLEQKLEELASLLNLLTLNLVSEPLKELGIHVQPPMDAKRFTKEQSAVTQIQGNIDDMINSVTSRMDSIIEVLKINQYKMQEDLNTLHQHLDKLDGSVLQCEDRTAEELDKLAKSIYTRSVSGGGVVEPLIQHVPDKSAENAQWWSKASTFTSVVCTALTASALLYELFK